MDRLRAEAERRQQEDKLQAEALCQQMEELKQKEMEVRGSPPGPRQPFRGQRGGGSMDGSPFSELGAPLSWVLRPSSAVLPHVCSDLGTLTV